MIEIHAIQKTYNGTRVLDTPAFSVKEGHICAIIGANGSGKTTLIRILAGILPADGHKKCLPAGLTVGYMPQKSYPFRMSVRKNLLLADNDPKKAEEMEKSFSLSSLSKRQAQRLSGGETARLAMARLLMKDFDLLLLDEPSASMDMEATILCEKMLSRRRDEGATMLLITHSLQQARRLADEVLFLQKGHLIEYGPVRQVLESPQHEETRAFLEFFGV